MGNFMVKTKLEIFTSKYSVEIKNSMLESFKDIDYVEDGLNDKSIFIVLSTNNEIISTARLIESIDGQFARDSANNPGFIYSEKCWDLGRVHVINKYRGNIYFDYIMFKSFQFSRASKIDYLNGGSAIGRKMQERLEKFGFEKTVDPFEVNYEQKRFLGQPYVIDLIKSENIWKKQLDICEIQLNNEYDIIDTLI